MNDLDKCIEDINNCGRKKKEIERVTKVKVEERERKTKYYRCKYKSQGKATKWKQ